MAKLKNGMNDYLDKDLLTIIDTARFESRLGLDNRTIENHRIARKKEKEILMDKLVRYITKRDQKVFDVAFEKGQKNERDNMLGII